MGHTLVLILIFNYINISMFGFLDSKLFMGALFIIFALYVLLLFSIMGDLWSGIRKAKRRGEARSSYGYRCTIDKIARYYNAMIMLTVMDCMQMISLWFMHDNYEWTVPIFPFVTMIGAIGFSLIEVKSMFEKADRKDKVKYQKLGELMMSTLRAKDDPSEIAEKVVRFIEGEQNKDTEVKDEQRNKK